MSTTQRIIVLGVLVWIIGLGEIPASAQTTDVDKQARDIHRELLSPYCPGLSLYSCQSGQARELRDSIRQRLADGETREQIVASLVEEFGPTILGSPPNEGLGRAAWLGPITAIGLGALFVVIVLRQFKRGRRRLDTVAQEVDPAIRSRLEEELESQGRE